MDSAEIKELVRSRYGSIAAASSSCCTPTPASLLLLQPGAIEGQPHGLHRG